MEHTIFELNPAEVSGARDTNAQRHTHRVQKNCLARKRRREAKAPTEDSQQKATANRDKSTTPYSAQALPACTHKAFSTGTASDIHVVLKNHTLPRNIDNKREKLRHTPKTHSQQIRHGNLHPLLPAKKWRFRARIQLQHCFSFCKVLFDVKEWCLAANVQNVSAN